MKYTPVLMACLPIFLHACGPADGEPENAPFGLDERPQNQTCSAPDRPQLDANIRVQPAFENLQFSAPTFMVPGLNGNQYVLEQDGIIWRIDSEGERTTFADLRSIVNSNFDESGLLGMAFHPNFRDNGEIYLSYTTGNTQRLDSELVRATSSDGGATLDAEREILITQSQFAANHNGGGVAFGPDGHLYWGLGDGGGANDPEEHGQNVNTLLASMVRIDISPATGYAIPPDNPFANGGGAPEIYAWGLRNPWRFSFDRGSGELWVGDVGQDTWEEINLVERGGNYGWKLKEGFHCRGSRTGLCEQFGDLKDPVIAYGTDVDGESITGGYVYRGSAIPELQGVYLYADFAYGTVWGLFYDEVTGEPAPRVLLETGEFLASFAEDAEGELYLIAYGQNGGRILSIVPTDEGGERPAAFPATLSSTGCVSDDDVKLPASTLVPYDVVVPFWSDGAEKQRFVAFPDEGEAVVDDEGNIELPVGSVVVKNFDLNGERIETRLMVRHEDGEWGGYSYAWRDDQSDADLLPGAASKVFGDQTWSYPSRAQCLACHTRQSKRTLGLTVDQLSKDAIYAQTQRRSPQLDTWAKIGFLDEAPTETEVLADPFGSEELEKRARSYLQVNCANCHQPGALGLGESDLRITTPLADAQICDEVPQEGTLGLDEAFIVNPQDPGASVLFLRVNSTDVSKMPNIGRNVIDERGADLLEEWILDDTTCVP